MFHGGETSNHTLCPGPANTQGGVGVPPGRWGWMLQGGSGRPCNLKKNNAIFPLFFAPIKNRDYFHNSDFILRRKLSFFRNKTLFFSMAQNRIQSRGRFGAILEVSYPPPENNAHTCFLGSVEKPPLLLRRLFLLAPASSAVTVTTVSWTRSPECLNIIKL